MTKRRRILHADKIIQNVIHLFCLLMFLQLKGYYSLASNPILLYSTESDIRIVNTSKLNKVVTVMKALEQGSAVDFLYSKSLICWSDQTAELIQCMKYNDTYSGDTVRIVSEGLTTPTGLAIDWYTEKIYWTDGETNKIEVISIEQKYRKVLFWTEVDLARAIAVVPSKGLMFWTDWGEVPKIEKAGMNGDPATRKIIVKDNIFWPNGITVDYDKEIIYWVDAKLHFVDAVDFNGGKRKRIVKSGLVYPYALTVTDDKLFWTDWKTWAIHTWDISTHGPIKDLLESHPVPVDIKVYNSSRQVLPQEYPCRINNGMCSHLCLLSPLEPGYTCACPTGVKLKENSNTTCYNSPQSMLIVAQRSSISKISLDSPDFTPYTLPLKDLKRALTVDYDPKTEFIYWADNLAKTISKARLDGTEQSVVLHSEGVPDSIAIDPLARNIYWSDPAMDTINVARLDGSSKKILIHSELYDPRAIALHPSAGWMFWSDWNDKKPKIERANLDGSERMLIVSERLAWPNGIALDLVTNKLYWGDARTHKIEVCNMDGKERQELHGSEILHIFGLTLLGQHLYWTDMQKRTLDRINKDTGLDREPVVDQMANMMGVKAIRVGEPLGWSRCSENNGGCSHLCFNRPQDYVCACPLDLELTKDNRTCVEPSAFLLYSRKNIIGRISIDNENNDAILPIKDIKEVSALAIDIAGSKIYWADSKLKTIKRCSLDGSNTENIIEGVGLVEGIAIDWAGQNIYWTDTATQRIEMARLDGSSRRALIWQGLKKPKSIVLDLKKGMMYWSESGIKRATLWGGNVSPWGGAAGEGAGRVSALALGVGGALCWAALDPAALLCAPPRVHFPAPPPALPYALAATTDTLYWGDWNTGIVEAVKLDGSERQTIHTGLDYISELQIWTRDAKHDKGTQCSVDNGGCTHLCISASTSRPDFRCACPTHYRLRPDNVSCAEPEEFLLFAQKNSIGRIMVAPGECNDAYIPVTGLKNIKAIEYDPVDKQLYWIEEESSSIRRVSVSPRGAGVAPVLVAVAPHAAHLALDAVGRTLYWTATAGDTINVTSLTNHSHSGVLLRANNIQPRHLAFHQTKRYLIWHEARSGVVVRGNVDGSGRVELARAPNLTALTVDHGDDTVYWAAARQIHAVNIDGTNRRVVWQGGWAWCARAYGGALYLCGERALLRLPLRRREAPAATMQHIARPVALALAYDVPRSHPCYGGGSCAVAACGAGGECSCGLACQPHTQQCDAQHFLCDDNNCIPQHWKCDGQRDCSDGSDEAWCGACAGGLRCVDGSCAAALHACADGAYCAPQPLPNAFRCDERLCLAPALVCDGRQHCEDGTDEASAACGPGAGERAATGAARGGALAVCGGLAGAGAAAAATALLLRRWRRKRARPPPPAALPLCATKPPSTIPPTDTSSTTESGCGRYPRPTLNPPPSPATVSEAPRRRTAYRHYRSINRPPPPTPASTDACESEVDLPAASRAPPPSPAPPTLLY